MGVLFRSSYFVLISFSYFVPISVRNRAHEVRETGFCKAVMERLVGHICTEQCVELPMEAGQELNRMPAKSGNHRQHHTERCQQPLFFTVSSLPTQRIQLVFSDYLLELSTYLANFLVVHPEFLLGSCLALNTTMIPDSGWINNMKYLINS